eukprot:825666-Prorocentrum_minimum.AAC.6
MGFLKCGVGLAGTVMHNERYPGQWMGFLKGGIGRTRTNTPLITHVVRLVRGSLTIGSASSPRIQCVRIQLNNAGPLF